MSFECSQCPRKFRLKVGLSIHIWKKHGATKLVPQDTTQHWTSINDVPPSPIPNDIYYEISSSSSAHNQSNEANEANETPNPHPIFNQDTFVNDKIWPSVTASPLALHIKNQVNTERLESQHVSPTAFDIVIDDLLDHQSTGKRRSFAQYHSTRISHGSTHSGYDSTASW
jgi:hypothetical protein